MEQYGRQPIFHESIIFKTDFFNCWDYCNMNEQLQLQTVGNTTDSHNFITTKYFTMEHIYQQVLMVILQAKAIFHWADYHNRL
jgi:hypothetical protein